MRINSISNSQNYSKQQNFGINISEEARVHLRKYIEGKKRIFPHSVIGLIKGAASDATSLDSVNIKRSGKSIIATTKLTYGDLCIEQPYSCWKDSGKLTNLEEMKKAINKNLVRLIARVMDGLQCKGTLETNLIKLKADFPNHIQFIEDMFAIIREKMLRLGGTYSSYYDKRGNWVK